MVSGSTSCSTTNGTPGSLRRLTRPTASRTVGRTMSTKEGRLLRESVAPYSSEAEGRHTKISISLPTELVEAARAAAAEHGSTVSAVIAASLRHSIREAEQAAIDRSLELDADDSAAWAEAYASVTAKMWERLEW